MRARLFLIPLAFAASAACGGSDSTGPGSTGGNNTGGNNGGGSTATTAVTMQGNAFSPASIKVASGATVNWTNSDGYNHNVTFAATSNIGTTGNFSTGTMSLKMPSAAGTYSYQCTIHPGMTGSVTVQ